MSTEKLFKKYPVRQIGYYVKDVKEAAKLHSQLFGSGPYLVMENLKFDQVSYRGKKSDIVQSVSMGQWGDVQVEFCAQHSPEPSYYTDLGHYGIHHFCIWSDDVNATIKEFQDAGYELAEMMETQGMKFAIIDCTKDLGHFVEIHLPMVESYANVKAMSEGFDGKDVLRSLG